MLFVSVFSPFLAGQVKEQMKLLKHLYLAVSGLSSDEEEVELPDDLTAGKMVTVVTLFFKASNNVIENAIKELVAKVGAPLCTESCFPRRPNRCWRFAVALTRPTPSAVSDSFCYL